MSHNLRADHYGFLIPDRALASIDEALSGIDANIARIVRLLEGHRIAGARVRSMTQRTAPQIARTAQTTSANIVTAAASRMPQRLPPTSPQISRQNANHLAIVRAGAKQEVMAASMPRQAVTNSVRLRSGGVQAATQASFNAHTGEKSEKLVWPALRPGTPAARDAELTTPARDQRGRFVSKGSDTNDNAGANNARHDDASSNAAGEHALRERLSGVLSKLAHLPALTGDVSHIDPTVDALMEMKGVMEGPIKLMRSAGTAMLARGSRRKAEAQVQVATPWHQRMLKTIGLARTEASAFHHALTIQRDKSSATKKVNKSAGGMAAAGDSGIITSAIKMLFSPIGALAVSALGAWMYSARDQLSDAMVTGMKTITDTWDSAVKGFSSVWNNIGDNIGGWVKAKLDVLFDFGASVKDKLGNAVQVAKETIAPLAPLAQKAASTANAVIKDSTGVDIKAGAQMVATSARSLASKTIETASDTATRAQAAGGSLLEKVLPKGYRHKAMFDGVKGGTGLTKNGSYTDDEAQQIRDLKASGANTSANLKGGMPADVQQKIINQAKAAGLNPEMMLQIAAMESGGNANAISSTGAIGIYQFTGKTATGVGIKNRFDADENIAGGMKLTQQNMLALQAASLPVTAENLYMMHQLGATAAQEIIRGAQNGTAISSLSPNTQKAVSLNYGANAKTAQEYLGKNQTALVNRANEVIGKSQAGFLPTGGAAVPTIAATTTPPPAATNLTPAAAPTVTPVSAVAPTGVLAVAPSIAVATQIKSIAAAKPPTPVAPPPAPQLETAMRLNSAAPLEVIVRNEQAVAQDVPDRRLAAIASGGLSQM